MKDKNRKIRQRKDGKNKIEEQCTWDRLKPSGLRPTKIALRLHYNKLIPYKNLQNFNFTQFHAHMNNSRSI